MNIQKYIDMKEEFEEADKQYQRAVGALQQLENDLEKQYGKTEEELKEWLENEKEELQTKIKTLDSLEEQFHKKWKGKVG